MDTSRPDSRRSADAAAALYARIHAAIAQTPAAAIHTRERIIAAAIIVPLLTAIAVATISELVYDRQAVGLQIGLFSTSRLAAVGFIVAALTIGATVLALRRGRSGLGSASMYLALCIASVAPVYAALMLAVPVHTPHANVPSVEISPLGWRCFLLAMLVGLMALASFGIALYRAVAVAVRLRAATLGAAAGAWAGLATFVFCPSGEHQHLMIGHVLPVIALTILGSVALVRVLRT
jgi:hypothetical protein